MKQQNRRIFILHVVAGTSALASAELMAQEKKISTVKLAEDDKYAKTMGFVTTPMQSTRRSTHDMILQRSNAANVSCTLARKVMNGALLLLRWSSG